MPYSCMYRGALGKFMCVEQEEAPSRQLWRHRICAFVRAQGIPRAI
jgi:hypothetical protein